MEKSNVKKLNVPRNNIDPFYRYTMPALLTRVEGRGKMIKTVLVNLSDVAIALERSPEYILKFIGYELSTAVESKNNRFVVSGSRNSEELYEILDGFIEKYVLCSHCGLPETDMDTSKDYIYLYCRACGGKGSIPVVSKFEGFMAKKEATTKQSKKEAKKSEAKQARAAQPTTATPLNQQDNPQEDESD
eukprot:TRINITY_DN1327_c0_g1_i1.p1 TRINITY_DN1327_c0_g1~~TRINITY_DN1327_c0_g1_i1.p1  ORF type:complete len:189 (+),score=47.85 TRINITY_DN1327_c0_g1_i1:70-636(+)